jgi:YVTN family beta-propeller protein
MNAMHFHAASTATAEPRGRPLGPAARGVLFAAFVALATLADGGRAADLEVPRLRRPVAVALSSNERFLYSANQSSGSISVIDLSTRRVVAEVDVARRISEMISPADGRLLATDEAAHELLILDAAGPRVEVRQRLAVAPFPVSLAASADGRLVAVSSLWSRRLSFVETDDEGTAQLAGTLDMPFAPRRLVLARENRQLVVGDAFGGRLGVVDVPGRSLRHVHSFPAHNIRGLATSPDGRMLLVAHQMLNEVAHSVRNDVHWGLLMSNDLRWLRLDAVLDPARQFYEGAHMHPMGDAGRAGGDPAGLAVARDGTVVVPLGGVGFVALGKERDFSFGRMKAGRRPTAVAIAADSATAYVANSHGDSITVLDLVNREGVGEISLGPMPELSLVERGEVLFYDARLSHDGWMSCHSCHTDGHANGFLNDNFSDRSFGAPKRVLSLLGLSDTAPYAWNGEKPGLVEQIRTSITTTMQADGEPSDDDLAALAAYVRAFTPPPPVDALRGTRDEEAVSRGRELFAEQNCRRCHAPPTYTTPRTYDVGLVDEEGNRRFNPPSLRGAGQRGPYFHDNRAVTLEDVFLKHGHQLRRPFSADEVRDLAAFLRSL